MTFTETNQGSQPIPVVVDGSDGSFAVSQNGTTVWSPLGADQDLEWGLLPPGQSIVQTGSWDGLDYSGQAEGPGTYVITDGIDPNGSSVLPRSSSRPTSRTTSSDSR
jgi:hypothetical protein